jgi:hypothetical protein
MVAMKFGEASPVLGCQRPFSDKSGVVTSSLGQRARRRSPGTPVRRQSHRYMPTVEVWVWLRGARVGFERAQFASVARDVGVQRTDCWSALLTRSELWNGPSFTTPPALCGARPNNNPTTHDRDRLDPTAYNRSQRTARFPVNIRESEGFRRHSAATKSRA